MPFSIFSLRFSLIIVIDVITAISDYYADIDISFITPHYCRYFRHY
jgi:hypothetical protein